MVVLRYLKVSSLPGKCTYNVLCTVPLSRHCMLNPPPKPYHIFRIHSTWELDETWEFMVWFWWWIQHTMFQRRWTGTNLTRSQYLTWANAYLLHSIQPTFAACSVSTWTSHYKSTHKVMKNPSYVSAGPSKSYKPINTKYLQAWFFLNVSSPVGEQFLHMNR